MNAKLLAALVHDSGKIEGFSGPSDFKAAAAKVLVEWGEEIPLAPISDLLNTATISLKPIQVSVNGVKVEFPKGVSPPRLIEGRAYARACSISAALHIVMATYLLGDTTGVILDKPGLKIDLPIDSHLAWVDDGIEQIAQPARLIKGEGFFPIRWVAERLGASVKWNSKLRTVEIQMNEIERIMN